MAFNEYLIKNSEGGIQRLVEIMRALRDPNDGCPWDIEQNFQSIAPYTIEEAYEVADAIERKNWNDLRSELGDLLLQSIYHSQMASEQDLFDFDDVVKDISEKMIARHPHVFGEESRNKSAQQQTQDWENIKAQERAAKSKKGVLDDVALGLPALMRAIKLQKRAARVGFDWNDVTQVLDKIIEESHELVEAQQTKDKAKIQDEFGDLLFVMVNLGRHLDIDAEEALRGTNAKFTRRFRYIETELNKSNIDINSATLEEMENLWEDAKLSD